MTLTVPWQRKHGSFSWWGIYPALHLLVFNLHNIKLEVRYYNPHFANSKSILLEEVRQLERQNWDLPQVTYTLQRSLFFLLKAGFLGEEGHHSKCPPDHSRFLVPVSVLWFLTGFSLGVKLKKQNQPLFKASGWSYSNHAPRIFSAVNPWKPR